MKSAAARRGLRYRSIAAEGRPDLGGNGRRPHLAHRRRRRTLGERHSAELTPWSKIGTIEPSHFDPNTAYAAIDRHRIEDQAPHILRTRDGGRTWQEIDNGLPNSGGPNSVNVVREDPVQRGLLFAGTERGLFVSFDDGEHWQPLQNGLPTTSVRDITIHGDDLVIATHGRGFYVMDDIVPLRSLAADPARATRLFPVATAIRVNEPTFTGTPMPKDEPMAQNPPLGAYIDYNLQSAPRTPVIIRIFDASGAAGEQLQQCGSGQADRPFEARFCARVGRRPEAPRGDPRRAPLRLEPALCAAVRLQGRSELRRTLGTAGRLHGRARRRRAGASPATHDRARPANFGQPRGLPVAVHARSTGRAGSRSRHTPC